jgi:hypothetical protein
VYIYLDNDIFILSRALSITSADGNQPSEPASLFIIYHHLLDRLIIDYWSHAYERLQTSDPYKHSEALPDVAYITFSDLPTASA